MDSPEAKIAELEQLLWRMRDGVIDAAGRARIEALVTGDAAVRRFYIRYSTLCGGLRWLNAQEEGSGFRVQEISQMPPNPQISSIHSVLPSSRSRARHPSDHH